jgi:hypothetical protein
LGAVKREQSFEAFVAWWRQYCKGDEKGEAQIFLDRLFTAFGYAGGLRGAQGDPEKRIRFTLEDKPSTKFADLVIPGRVLIEMKKRGENLARHRQQAAAYWLYLTPHPRYVVLCNFDEFWVYDMDYQIEAPIDKVAVDRLAENWGPLAFLFPEPETPVFNREFDLVDLTEQAAYSLSQVFRLLTRKGREIEREQAQRFILQCMVALFAEDIGLLPRYTFTRVVEDCLNEQAYSFDLFTSLFTMMNVPGQKRAGRFYGVDYFNGGIFSHIYPIALEKEELRLLREAANQNWSQIHPAIFGRIFEYSIETGERHRSGAHYTSERDIMRIVEPVIARPWRERIEAASSADDLRALHTELCAYQVLDPACGSGNFLYIAYREMKDLERALFDALQALGESLPEGRVTARQFHGFDTNSFAVELAKVTLMIAKKQVVDKVGGDEQPLPLDNLDDNIRCEDALFAEWPPFDACIGNPPYMGAKRLKQEHPPAYINRVRAAFPDVPGNADYCVYWFRKAHELMRPGTRAGLVGTNTVRQNYSREGGLDYIVARDGHIYDAVSSMPWSGEANVHVSIVNWSKGEPPTQPAALRFYEGEGENGEINWREYTLPLINSALSEKTDVSGAAVLACNREPKRVFQGQIPGNEHFVLNPADAKLLVDRDQNSRKVLFPFLIGRDLIARPKSQPSRWVIDFSEYDLLEAQQFGAAYDHVETHILPVRKAKAAEEAEKNRRALSANPKARTNRHHEMFLNQWWKPSYGRADMLAELAKIKRFVGCSQVTKRPIFDFISSQIRPDVTIQVFAFEDDYSFGILQSDIHWRWFTEKGSTLTERYRYTPNSVFDTFPWPQNPTPAQVKAVAEAGRTLHEYRRERMSKSETLTLRDLYRSLELPGQNPLKDLHAALDAAVLAAYGFDADGDVLAQLLALNQTVAARIEAGEPVTAPGIPPDYPNPDELVSEGCIQPPELI